MVADTASAALREDYYALPAQAVDVLRGIGALSLVSLAMVFVVLYSRYGAVSLALIVMANIPLALIGSVVALTAWRGSTCARR